MRKKISAIIIILASMAFIPFALAAGGGPVTAAKPLGVEKGATAATIKLVSGVRCFWLT